MQNQVITLPFANLSRLIALLFVAACGPPAEAIREPSADITTLPPPDLAPTSAFSQVMTGAEPDADRIAQQTDGLAARARALETRAAGLSGDVVEPEIRSRLQTALEDRMETR